MSCWWTRIPYLIVVCGVAIAPAAAQELRISHQFHAENDSRGQAFVAWWWMPGSFRSPPAGEQLFLPTRREGGR